MQIENGLQDIFDFGPRVVRLIGGPLDGDFHEVQSGFPCPSVIGQRCESGIAEYRVCFEDETAEFIGIRSR